MSESENGESKNWLGRVTDLFKEEPSNRGELLEILRVARDREILDGDALNIIYGALQVADMQAREIMIPRTQIVSIGVEAPIDQILGEIIRAQHSRFPVVGEDLDDVKGVLHAKDLLSLSRASPESRDDFDIKDCIRPATVIPESKRLNVLLQDFRAKRNHMAIVVDEYGNTSGIVTIEDVLEQIVGEIEDEHDANDTAYIKQLDATSFTVKALTPVAEFNEHFECRFRVDEFDTIGGVVLQHFGHMPKREDSIDIEGFTFTVLNADSRRIRLLQLTTPVSVAGE